MIIRRDLASEHFDGPFIPGRSGPRVGDQRLDQPGWMPPRRGTSSSGRPARRSSSRSSFATRFSLPDGEGLSTRADGPRPPPKTGHTLRITVKLADLPAAELFCAQFHRPGPEPNGPSRFRGHQQPINAFPVPGGSLVYSRWARDPVLAATQRRRDAGHGRPALPLYSLRRRVRVLAAAGQNYVVANSSVPQLLMASYPDLAHGRTSARLPGGGGELFGSSARRT